MSREDIGYILSVIPYREYDAMLEFYGQNHGLLRFVLRGFYRPGSKQGSLGNEFTKVRVRFRYHENRLLNIQSGELLESYSLYRSDYDWLMLMSLMTELVVKLYDPKQNKFWFDKLDILYSIPSISTMTLILRDVIIISGIEPVVNHCVITGNTQVSDFSIKHGGFVSKKYRTSRLSLEDLKSIYKLFSGSDDFNSDPYILCNLFIKYIEFHMDLKINSWKLIYSI